MSTRKKNKKKKRVKTRKRGNRGLKLAVGALALSTLGSATASRSTVQGFNKVSNS